METERVVLQIPMTKDLRIRAEEYALFNGFSSLQEVVRVIVSKLAIGEIAINIYSEPKVALSPKAQRRYGVILEDYKTGKNLVRTTSRKDLIDSLTA